MSTMRDLIAGLPRDDEPPRDDAFTAVVMERVRVRPVPVAAPRPARGWLAVAASIVGAALLPLGLDGIDGGELLPTLDAALAADLAIAVLVLLPLGWIAAGRRA